MYIHTFDRYLRGIPSGMNIRSYASKLATSGFDEMDCLKCAQLEDLTAAGVLVGHARKIALSALYIHAGD